MAPRDPYLRAWAKFLTYMLDQPEYKRLTFEQFGVFTKAVLYSMQSSRVIGYFLDRESGEPRSLEEIAWGLEPRVGNRDDNVKRVGEAFEAFLQPPLSLMRFEEDNGYSFEPAVFEQFLWDKNIDAKRKADAQRQQRHRRKTAKKRGRGPCCCVAMGRPDDGIARAHPFFFSYSSSSSFSFSFS